MISKSYTLHKTHPIFEREERNLTDKLPNMRYVNYIRTAKQSKLRAHSCIELPEAQRANLTYGHVSGSVDRVVALTTEIWGSNLAISKIYPKIVYHTTFEIPIDDKNK